MLQALRAVWSNPYVRVLVLIAALVAAYLLLQLVRPAVVTFFVALSLAYLANPLVVRLEKLGARRAFGVALVYSLLVIALFGISRMVTGTFRQAFVVDAEGGPNLAETVTAWIENLPQRLTELLPSRLAELASEPLAAIRAGLEQILSGAVVQLDSLGAGLYDAIAGTVTGAFQLFLILILTIYLLYDFERFTNSLLQLFPRPYQPAARDLAAKLDAAMGAFIRGQFLVAIAVGLMVWLGLSVVGIPGAALIGLLAGMMNVVPFLGSVVPVIPAVLVALGGGWLTVLGVLAVFVVVNQIDNHLLTPLILGRATALHPVTVIVAVVAGFAAFGILGGILAVPLAAFFKVLYVEFYQRSRFYREG